MFKYLNDSYDSSKERSAAIYNYNQKITNRRAILLIVIIWVGVLGCLVV